MTTIDAHKRDPYDGLPVVPGFQLKSSAIADGETMPVAQRSAIVGAGGQDTSPDLEWSGFPEETQSFIVTMYDPDLPTPSGSGTGRSSKFPCIGHLAAGRSRRW